MLNKKAFAMVFEDIQKPFNELLFDLPEIGESEILVKIKYTTICTSDLHTFYGRRKSPTHSILGHEIMGEVEKIPKNGIKDFYGNDLNIGNTITWSVYAHDADDKFVKLGIPQKSISLFKYGHQKIDNQHQLSGGFATHFHLKKGSTIFKVPENLTQREAAPLNCTHATIAGAIRLAGNIEDKNVLVCGVGMLGLSACAMAKEAGANTVFAMDINENRLEKSKQFGVDTTINSTLPFTKQLKESNSLGGVDIVIETSGVPSAIENTIQMLNIGGTIVLVGSVFSQRDISVNAEVLVRKLLTIKGLHNYIHQDLGYAIDFLSKNNKKYPFEKLVEKEFSLKELDAAFEYAHTNSCFRVGINSLI